MSQTPVTVKIDAEVKQQAQQLGKQLGLSLSAIVENKLREVVRERRVVFEAFTPNQSTAKILQDIEQDVKAGRNLSGPFTGPEQLEQHLNSLGHAD